MRLKQRIMLLAGGLAAAGSVALATAPAHAAAPPPAVTAVRAPAYTPGAQQSGPAPSEIILNMGDSGEWCVTDLGTAPYSKVVLGKCAFAQSQLFWEYQVATGTYELENAYSTGCLTLANTNGYPDGQPVVLGTCAVANSQLFMWARSDYFNGTPPILGSHVFLDNFIFDSNGNAVAIDDANGVLAAYNPITTSYYGAAFHQEDFYGPVIYNP